MTKKIPTPTATAKIKVRLGMEGTCSAKTCKSGSDMVMINPMIKLIRIITNTFLDLVMMVPTRSPMGVMDISTPTLKNNIPTVNSVAPMRKVIRMLGGIGAIVKHNNNTIAKIGNTAFKVSVNFSWNLERVDCNLCISFPMYFQPEGQNSSAKFELQTEYNIGIRKKV